MLTGHVFSGPDGCTSSAKPGRNSENIIALKIDKKTWDVELFPNPTSKMITLISKIKREKLKVVIRDLSSRVVYATDLETNDFLANLEFNLDNGAYFIIISNENNDKIIKKLLISK